MILVMKLRGYVRSATMGMRTRSTSVLGNSFRRPSTSACKQDRRSVFKTQPGRLAAVTAVNTPNTTFNSSGT